MLIARAAIVALIAVWGCVACSDAASGGPDGEASLEDASAQDASAADASPLDGATDAGADAGEGDARDAAVIADVGGGDNGNPDGGDDGGGCAPAVKEEPGLAVTESGAVHGALDGGAYVFLGIPYAAPPIGDRRWRGPAPHDCWTGVRDADAFGEVCTQVDDTGVISGGEDCLTTNIWTPSDYAQAQKRPVLVFVHGGGHILGSSAETLDDGSRAFDGRNLAVNTGSVVVTLNYRLGVFGWIVVPALSAGDPDGAAGNYGLRDQIALLGWVRRNIAHFGGDPDRVMVFGESAGAVDVCMLAVSPAVRGLFRAAVMESGTCMARTRALAESYGASFVRAAGCDAAPDVPACLRALDTGAVAGLMAERLTLAERWNMAHPSVDGKFIPGRPIDLIAAGTWSRVPLVVGSNADETDLAVDAVMLESDYKAAVYSLLGGDTAAGDKVLAKYPISDYLFVSRNAYVAVTTDRKFTCPVRRAVRAAVNGGAPAWRYLFTHAFKNNPLFKSEGAFHGIELNFVFDHLDVMGYIPTQGEKIIRDRIEKYWGHLAAAGDPNDGYLQNWPAYDPATDPYLQFEDPIAVSKGVRSDKCDLWDSIDSAGNEY